MNFNYFFALASLGLNKFVFSLQNNWLKIRFFCSLHAEIMGKTGQFFWLFWLFFSSWEVTKVTFLLKILGNKQRVKIEKIHVYDLTKNFKFFLINEGGLNPWETRYADASLIKTVKNHYQWEKNIVLKNFFSQLFFNFVIFDQKTAINENMSNKFIEL